jgi:hypothetical protein
LALQYGSFARAKALCEVFKFHDEETRERGPRARHSGQMRPLWSREPWMPSYLTNAIDPYITSRYDFDKLPFDQLMFLSHHYNLNVEPMMPWYFPEYGSYMVLIEDFLEEIFCHDIVIVCIRYLNKTRFMNLSE